MENHSLSQQIYDLIYDYEAQLEQKYQNILERSKELEQEVAQLRKAASSQDSPIQCVRDAELKERLKKLGAAPSDTLIRESGVILENRIRSLVGEGGKNAYGVRLIDFALKPESGKFQVSQHGGEQEGIHMLYRGAIQFIRNPPMHKLIDYPETTTWVFITLIDSLLVLFTEVAQIEEQAPSEKPVQWSPDKLRKAFESLADKKVANKLATALKVGLEEGIFIPSTARNPRFSFKGQSGKRLISFHHDGIMYLCLLPDLYESEQIREEAFNTFKASGLLDKHLNLSDIQDGRYSLRSLSEFDESETERFFEDLLRYCR